MIKKEKFKTDDRPFNCTFNVRLLYFGNSSSRDRTARKFITAMSSSFVRDTHIYRVELNADTFLVRS